MSAGSLIPPPATGSPSMRSPDQAVWDFVQQWLEKARQDLLAAETLLQSGFVEGAIVGFHAQQAAEKFIKALLVRHQVPFAKTHDLTLLRQHVSAVDSTLAGNLTPADALTPYGVDHRYPGGAASITRAEAEQAVRTAQQVRDLVLAALASYLTSGRPGGP